MRGVAPRSVALRVCAREGPTQKVGPSFLFPVQLFAMAAKFISIQHPPDLLDLSARKNLEQLFRKNFEILEVRWTKVEGIDDFVIDGASEGIDHAVIHELLWEEEDGPWDGCDDDY